MKDVLNYDRYPLDDLSQGQLEKWQSEFQNAGVCVLEDFIAPEALEKMIVEARSIESRAFHNELTGNAYLDDIDESLPEDHARRLVDTTSLGAVAYDQIPGEHLIRKVYESDIVLEFIEKVTQLGKVHRYECDLGALNIAVMKNGQYLRWHFDQSEFVVSIPLQEARIGGEFEYVHNIRTSSDEKYDDVKALLQGDHSRVEVLKAKPGSLILFQGMNTIHRVSRIEGDQPRLGALLGYALKPGVRSSEYLKVIRYGRSR